MRTAGLTMTHHTSRSQFFQKPLAMYRPAIERLASLDGAIRNADLAPPAYGLVNGIAIIPIQGVLARGVPCFCDGTDYDWIRAGFDCALADPEVKAIVFDVDSPGGTVEGCFDLADHIFNSRGIKPIWSILGESAYSAAYALASAADKMTVPRTGGAGSIGIVACHVDISKALKAAGVKVTYIQFGERKTDAAEEKPLSDAASASFQADVNELGKLFVATVERNRAMSASKVRSTEAATFLGSDAVALGLCDVAMAPNVAFQALSKILR